MSKMTLTDSVYQAIERAEQRKKRLMFIVLSCLLISVPGLGVNAFMIIASSHQKSGMLDSNVYLLWSLIAICTIVMIIGLNRFILLRNLEHKLDQLELLEETIYNEVLKSQID
jgi:hypothetical protein